MAHGVSRKTKRKARKTKKKAKKTARKTKKAANPNKKHKKVKVHYTDNSKHNDNCLHNCDEVDEEELIADFLDMYDMEDIKVIADYLFDTYDYDDDEAYDNEDESEDDSKDYYYSYN